jgi:hypothetical protein
MISEPEGLSSLRESYSSAALYTISLICDNSVTTQNLWFSRETFKRFEVPQFSKSATTTQLLSSGEFYKLRYDTIPVKNTSANVSFYTNNSKMPDFELWHSCCKWAICPTRNTPLENSDLHYEQQTVRTPEPWHFLPRHRDRFESHFNNIVS